MGDNQPTILGGFAGGDFRTGITILKVSDPQDYRAHLDTVLRNLLKPIASQSPRKA